MAYKNIQNVISKFESTCPVCGTCGGFPTLPYGGYHFAGRDMPLVRCDRCTMTFVVHGLSQENFSKIYNSDSYFDSDYAGSVTKKYSENGPAMMKKADFALKRIRRFAKAGAILDVGCAGGHFLKVARDKYGFEARGIEVSRSMSEFGRREYGIDIQNALLRDLPREWRDFSVIYLGDVLEHIPDPRGELQEIHKRLGKAGIVALELPLSFNITLFGLAAALKNLLYGRFGRQYFLPSPLRANYIWKPPYHIMMFNKKSISLLLERSGFDIVYLKIYEGLAKEKYGRTSPYALFKRFAHAFTLLLPQNIFGDRMLVIARRKPGIQP